MPARQHIGDFEELLRKKGLKVTPTRINILKLLKTKNTPQCLETISRALGENCDPATIYRNLRDFAQVGILEAHLFGDKKTWYSLAPHGSGHSHYLRCTSCNHTVEISRCDWHFLNSEVEKTYKFKNVTHQLEFTGLCPRCHKAPKSGH
jgi:Fe2+ or Zn2+ uptake regulation protein